MTAQSKRRQGVYLIAAIAIALVLALALQQSLALSLASWFAGLWVATMDLVLRLMGPLFGG